MEYTVYYNVVLLYMCGLRPLTERVVLQIKGLLIFKI